MPKKTRIEISLSRYDKTSFNDRLERLKYLNKIFPKGYLFGSDLETAYIFDEVKMTFVNGEFISTILLSQAFIERRLQIYYNSINLGSIGRRGLKALLDYAKKNHIIQNYLIERIDELRRKRNPFVHLKEYEDEHNLSRRVFKTLQEKKPFKQPMEIIMEDAKAAISLMYAVFITKLN